jgi:hypothetical protein
MSEPGLKRITLTLARTKVFPEGSNRHGYNFVAPLDEDGHIDGKMWLETRGACTVQRFWGEEPVRHGTLVHRAGGPGGAHWGFDYDSQTKADDEAGFRFGAHIFKRHEYVSIRDPDGHTETYKISDVRPL